MLNAKYERITNKSSYFKPKIKMKTTLCVSNYPQRFEGVVLHPLSLHMSRVRGAMSFLPAVCTAPHMTKCNNWVIFSKAACVDMCRFAISENHKTTKGFRAIFTFRGKSQFKM